MLINLCYTIVHFILGKHSPQDVPITFLMTQYSTHKKNKDCWFSPPFYSGSEGYKMCLNVYANGERDGTGSHVSLRVHLMRGEFDSQLVWPFKGLITIRLVNYISDGPFYNYYHNSVHFNDATVDSGRVSYRVTSSERAMCGWGWTRFISHNIVECNSKTRRYIDNDSLTFRITNIVVHSI